MGRGFDSVVSALFDLTGFNSLKLVSVFDKICRHNSEILRGLPRGVVADRHAYPEISRSLILPAIALGLSASTAYDALGAPKNAVSSVMGFLNGKSAIHIARVYAGRRRNFVGQHFWARGYWVSTVGKNEAAVRRYIQDQEKEDQRLDQMELKPL